MMESIIARQSGDQSSRLALAIYQVRCQPRSKRTGQNLIIKTKLQTDLKLFKIFFQRMSIFLLSVCGERHCSGNITNNANCIIVRAFM